MDDETYNFSIAVLFRQEDVFLCVRNIGIKFADPSAPFHESYLVANTTDVLRASIKDPMGKKSAENYFSLRAKSLNSRTSLQSIGSIFHLVQKKSQRNVLPIVASGAIAIHPARSRQIDRGVLCAIGVTVPRVKILPQFSTAVRRTEKLPVLTGGPLSYLGIHNFRSRHLIFNLFTPHEPVSRRRAV